MALEKYLKLMAELGNPVRIKCLPALAFSIARQRSTNKATKPPGKNWPRGYQKRHPALKPRRVRAMAWERHENNIYDKITHWFEVIGEVLEVACAAKEVVKGGKRGRKRKTAAQEAEEPEPEVARIIDAPVPWRAPVARMI
jgi:hypothetical protein